MAGESHVAIETVPRERVAFGLTELDLLRGGDKVLDQMRQDFALVRSVLDAAVTEASEADPAAEQLGLFG